MRWRAESPPVAARGWDGHGTRGGDGSPARRDTTRDAARTVSVSAPAGTEVRALGRARPSGPIHRSLRPGVPHRTHARSAPARRGSDRWHSTHSARIVTHSRRSRRVDGPSMCVFMGLLLPTCVADHRALSFPAEMRRILDPASAPTGRIDPARTDGPRGRDARGPEAPRAARRARHRLLARRRCAAHDGWSRHRPQDRSPRRRATPRRRRLSRPSRPPGR